MSDYSAPSASHDQGSTSPRGRDRPPMALHPAAQVSSVPGTSAVPNMLPAEDRSRASTVPARPLESHGGSANFNSATSDRPRTVHQPPNPDHLTLRALVATKEAGIIIGKGGVHIKSIRDESGARVNISEHIPGVQERVLSVTGAIEEVAKAYAQVARGINSSEPRINPTDSVEGTPLTLRYLIPNSRMGIVIGKGGMRIKEIQDESNARLAAQPTALPHSHDRLLEIVGVPDAIHIATYHMLVTIKEHSERPLNDRPYRPEYGVAMQQSQYPQNNAMPYHPQQMAAGSYQGNPHYPQHNPHQFHHQQQQQPNPYHSAHAYANPPAAGPQETRTFFCPPNKVGSMIGKGGSKINRIRAECGCRITVEEARGDRVDRPFTVIGPSSAVEKAIATLEQTLRRELQRDVQGGGGGVVNGNGPSVGGPM